jgi:hypothetical protein
LAFLEVVQAGPLNRADVDEHVSAAIVGLNEAKAFLLIKPFYGPGCHIHFLSRKCALTTPLGDVSSMDVSGKGLTLAAIETCGASQANRPKLDGRIYRSELCSIQGRLEQVSAHFDNAA